MRDKTVTQAMVVEQSSLDPKQNVGTMALFNPDGSPWSAESSGNPIHHNELVGLEEANAHSIDAITQLRQYLNNLDEAVQDFSTLQVCRLDAVFTGPMPITAELNGIIPAGSRKFFIFNPTGSGNPLPGVYTSNGTTTLIPHPDWVFPLVKDTLFWSAGLYPALMDAFMQSNRSPAFPVIAPKNSAALDAGNQNFGVWHESNRFNQDAFSVYKGNQLLGDIIDNIDAQILSLTANPSTTAELLRLRCPPTPQPLMALANTAGLETGKFVCNQPFPQPLVSLDLRSRAIKGRKVAFTPYAELITRQVLINLGSLPTPNNGEADSPEDADFHGNNFNPVPWVVSFIEQLAVGALEENGAIVDLGGAVGYEASERKFWSATSGTWSWWLELFGEGNTDADETTSDGRRWRKIATRSGFNSMINNPEDYWSALNNNNSKMLSFQIWIDGVCEADVHAIDGVVGGNDIVDRIGTGRIWEAEPNAGAIVIVGSDVAYAPSTPANWGPTPPKKIFTALDRLAIRAPIVPFRKSRVVFFPDSWTIQSDDGLLVGSTNDGNIVFDITQISNAHPLGSSIVFCCSGPGTVTLISGGGIPRWLLNSSESVEVFFTPVGYFGIGKAPI